MLAKLMADLKPERLLLPLLKFQKPIGFGGCAAARTRFRRRRRRRLPPPPLLLSAYLSHG